MTSTPFTEARIKRHMGNIWLLGSIVLAGLGIYSYVEGATGPALAALVGEVAILGGAQYAWRTVGK